MGEYLDKLYALVWGIPTLVLILGIGAYLSVRTGFAQLRLFPAACRAFWKKLRGHRSGSEGVTPFQALCTALAATVGTGNIAGVAGALAVGGPGAIFWMWICALLGMMTKLAEAALSVRYRVMEGGQVLAGPMYIIRQGMGTRWAWLGATYSFFGMVAAFGVGNATQINAVITGFHDCMDVFGLQSSGRLDLLAVGILSVIVLVLLLGGVGRIGRITETLVPFAAVAYLILGAIVLFLRAEYVPAAFSQIVKGALCPRAVTGGLVGSTFVCLRIGVSRGVFTNEAGMGTAGIAHGSADVRHPIDQGLMGIMEVFLDTIVICTITALVILCSGVPIPYGGDADATLTSLAFSSVLGDWVRVLIALSLCLFAFATVLGWGLYGARCAQYLFGPRVWNKIAWLQAVTVILGGILSTGIVWRLAEIINGLMAVPNLIALAVLSPELCRLIIDYYRKTGKSAGGGTLCKFPSMQTAANRPPCESSTPSRWQPRSRERKSTT